MSNAPSDQRSDELLYNLRITLSRTSTQLSTRERKHLINLLPKLHPTLLQLGGQPAVDAAIEACNQWP